MYTVLNDFIEKEHQGITYLKGEQYPKAGFEVNPERVAYLQSDDNPYRMAFLGPGLQEEVKPKGKSKSKEKSQEQPNQEESAKQDEK